MRVAAVVVIVIFGIMDALLVIGASKLEHEMEERELTEKRERDDT